MSTEEIEIINQLADGASYLPFVIGHCQTCDKSETSQILIAFFIFVQLALSLRIFIEFMGKYFQITFIITITTYLQYIHCFIITHF